jgi:hypothetical protein
VIIVQDDWVFTCEGILKNLLVQLIPNLTLFGEPTHNGIVLQIVVKVEVRCVIHLEIQLLVPHFVLTKILCIAILTQQEAYAEQ